MRVARTKFDPGWFSFLRGVGALLLALFIGLLPACKKPDPLPLQVHLGGCELLVERKPRLLCAVGPPVDEPLIIAVDGQPLAKLSIRVGNLPPKQTTIPRSGQLTLPVPFPTTASILTLRADSPDGVGEYTADVSPTLGFERAYKKDAEIDCKHGTQICLESVKGMIRGIDSAPRELDAAEQAFLLGLLGKKLWNTAKSTEPADEAYALDKLALATLERAMSEARAAGLLSVEAWALSRLGKVLGDLGAQYDPNLAAAKLSDPIHERALELCPEAAANVRYMQSKLAEALGDLAASKRFAIEGDALNARYSRNKSAQLETRQQTALAAQFLGETAVVSGLLRQIKDQLDSGSPSDPCRRAERYNDLGWTILVARQTGHPDAAPEDSFQKAADLIPDCKESRAAGEQRAVLLANRALYAIQQAEEAAPGSRERLLRLEEAEKTAQNAALWQPQARRVLQTELKLDLADIQARSALLRGKGQDALRAFAELQRRTITEGLTPYYRWTSLVGQADAHRLLGNKPAALRYYKDAESLLDHMAARLPMMARRQLFLGQFEAGTARYLLLLLEDPGSANTVVRVIRHARVRALRAYARGPGIDKGQDRTTAVMQQYWNLLDKRESAAWELQDAVGVEKANVERSLDELHREQETVLDSLYRIDPAVDEVARPAGPAASELIIACHPLPSNPGDATGLWVCAGETARGVKLVRIQAPTPEAPELAAQALLSALGDALQEVEQLRILPYGLLRSVAWAALPFAGGRIEDRFAVHYGVDLPMGASTAPATAGSILLVTNPEQNLDGAQRTGERLRHELRAAGGQLVSLEGRPHHEGQVRQPPMDTLRRSALAPALAKEVSRQLPGASLFVYYGHAESSSAGGWDSHLRLAEGSHLSAKDIMALPAVPQRVLLVGCETAVSDRDAQADEAGLAQAFVLRGSAEVLATTRKVNDVAAEALVGKLAQLGALRLGGAPLAAALRQAVAALRPGLPAYAADLDAFRVYTP